MEYDHDQRFKELIREFFPDFLRLFFADWAARFDLSAVEWLDKELMPEPPDGERHLLDLVAKVRAVVSEAGTPIPPTDGWVVLVHIEIESPDRTTTLKPRLPGYYHHLRSRYGFKVLPLALYLKVGLNGIGVDEVEDRLFDFVPNTFRYLYVGLPALDAEEYVAGDNWLGVALSALMRIPRERISQLGLEALRRISEAPVTDQQRFLLGECVEAYLDLPDPELQQFRDIIESNATGRVSAVNKTTYDRGKEAGLELGREQGRQEGEVLALRAAVKELYEAKCGAMPAIVFAMICASTDPTQLRKWLVAAGISSTYEEFRANTGA